MKWKLPILLSTIFIALLASGAYFFINKKSDNNQILGDSSTALRLASTTLFSDPNIVSLWEFENNMNDTVGSNDSTGGTLSAYGTSTPNGYGLFSFGGYFNGSPEMNFPTNNYQWDGFTFNAWVKYTAPSDPDGKIFDFKGTDRLYAAFQPDNTLAGVFTGYQPNMSAYENTWIMLTFTRSAAGSFVYLNGNSVAISSSSATTINFGQTSFSIGDEAGHTVNRHYKGNMDDLSLFSRVLTATEIASLYNGVVVSSRINNEVMIFD